MFQLFRSRKQAFRIMLGVIVAPVIITMVVTLIPGVGSSSFSEGGDTVLAEIGDETITLKEAQYQFSDFVRTQRMPVEAYAFVAPQVIQNLITEKIQLQEAQRLGLGVTEEELADLLRVSLPFLFPGGTYAGDAQLAAWVQDRFQRSIPEFEILMKKDLAISKLRRLVTDGVIVTSQEIEREYKRSREKARIEFVSLSLTSLEKTVTSTQAEIDEHFKKNRTNYTLPERRSFLYMVIDDTKVADKVRLTAQEIERYYNENKARYQVQDRSKVTHILFKTTDKKEDEIKATEAKAQEVLKQVKANKDFAELAKKNSEDTASAAKGGEIGWVTRGQTVPEFEQKAFSMKPGEISDLVKTQYGYHILKVLERETAYLKTLPQVEAEIRQELTRERSDLERARLGERARVAAARHGLKMEEAGRELGLPVLSAKLVERGQAIPEVGAEGALADSLFSALKGVVVGPIQMAGKSVIAVTTEISAPRQAELAELPDRVKGDANTAKAKQVAETRAQQLAEKSRALGGDLQRAAKEIQLEAKKTELFTRDGSVPGVGAASLLSPAFSVAIGSLQGPLAVGNDQIVYKVIERQAADMSRLEAESVGIRTGLREKRQTEGYEIFKEDLKDRLTKLGKVKIHQDRVDRFVSSNKT